MMVGRPVLFRLEKPDVEIGEPIVRVEGAGRGQAATGVDLEVRARGDPRCRRGGGERPAGAGRGVDRPRVARRGARILLDGTDITGRTVEEIRNAGVAYIPEDRHEQGLVLEMTLWENAVLGRQDDPAFAGRLGVLLIRKIKELASRLVGAFDVRARSIEVTASTLSGGNQQKLILARELDERAPRCWSPSSPPEGSTWERSSSSGARSWSRRPRAGRCCSISAELEEIYALSDRIVTIYEGRITGEYPPDTPPEEIGIGMPGGAGPGRLMRPEPRSLPDPARPPWLDVGWWARALALLAAFADRDGVGGAHHRRVRREPAHGLRGDPRLRVQRRRRASRRCSRSQRRLIFSALAVSVGFRAGLFNIGVEGQYFVGMVTAAWAALIFDFLPGVLHLIGGAPVRDARRRWSGRRSRRSSR